MKLKHGFILREIAGENIVIPAGDELNLNMMITLNETGAFLWERLNEETTQEALVAALLSEYDCDEATAQAAVAGFVQKLNDNGFLV